MSVNSIESPEFTYKTLVVSFMYLLILSSPPTQISYIYRCINSCEVLEILLLYKNTQEVNSHGLVGGLIGEVNGDKNGLMPACGYVRKWLDNEWYCLIVIDNSANVINIQSVSYVNQEPLIADIKVSSYDGTKFIKCKMDGTTNQTYDTKLKYKFDGNKFKLWIKSLYVSIQILHANNVSGVFVKQGPDSGAVDITGDI